MKKWIIAAAGLSVTVLALLVAFLLVRDGGNDNRIYVYFFNPYTRQMQAEIRPLPEENQAQRVVEYLYSEPVRTGTLVNLWPRELAPRPEDLVSAVKHQDSTLFAFFTPVFHEMRPLDQSLFKAAFIHTMNSLPSVSDIKILVSDNYEYAFEALMRNLSAEDDLQDEDGEDIPYMPLVIYDSSHAGIFIDPLELPISPHWIDETYTFDTYFVDSTGTGLVVESRRVYDVNRQNDLMAIEVLELLISGPQQEGALSLIPSETRVLNVDIILTDIFVNLSSDFERFIGSTELAELMVYSIVNTLLAEFSPSQTRVHFLIDTQQVEEFHGIENFHIGFERNDKLLLSYIEAQRYAYEYEYGPEEYE